MIIGALLVLAKLLLVLTRLLGPFDARAHPHALWHVVHDLCLRDARLTGRPAPCLQVSRAGGYVVVPDPIRPTQVLLAPTAPISGIESPALRAAGAINYWQAAWTARRFVAGRAGRPIPRDRIGMAINSATSRSQDLLHIHIDCVRSDVRAILKAHEGAIGPQWRPLGAPLAGHRYRARRLEGAELGARDPFRLLARGDAEARRHMGRQSMAVIGWTFDGGAPGFLLLADGAPGAFAESLLDHRCAVVGAA